MNTPTPAHVALVKGLQTAAYDFAVAESGQLLADASNRLCTARDAILDALAQPALAAPVPHQVPDSKAIEFAMSLPRFDYGYRSDEWGTGRSLGFIAKADGPVVRFADVVSFLAAQQPTPAASPEWRDEQNQPGVPRQVNDAGGIRSGVCVAQSLQPVATTVDSLRELLAEAIATIDSLPGYPKGADLCDQIETALAPIVEVAAPVAPSEPLLPSGVLLELSSDDLDGRLDGAFTNLGRIRANALSPDDKAALSLARKAIYDALAAPVPQPIDIDALADEILRIDGYGAMSPSELAEGLMPFILRRKAQQPTPAASQSDLDAISEMSGVKASVRNRREKREREAAEAQVMQPVEAVKLGPFDHLCKSVTGHRGGIFVCQSSGCGVSQGSYCLKCPIGHPVKEIPVEVASPVAPTEPTDVDALIAKHGMESLPNEGRQVWFTRKEVVRITRAALSAAKPQVLSDAQIRAAFLANGFKVKEGRDDLMPYVYEAARANLKLQAGGEEA